MKIYWPTFDESMRFSKNYVYHKKDLDKWKFIKDKYNEILNRPTQKQKIPKILHQVWLGDSMPNREIELCSQVKKYLPPDWQYKLWRNEDLKVLTNFTQKELFDTTPSVAQKSDLLRLHILWEYGGVYCDTDFVLNKPFEDLLDLDFFAGIVYDDIPNISNSILGSSPKNELITDMQTLETSMLYRDGMDIINTTGQGLITSKIFKHKNNFNNFAVLPNSFLYPFPNCPSCRNLGPEYKSYITKETYACHLWYGSWM